ncbi:MAG: hypothetical protein AAF890_03430 [Pseudomonadota bacterium]
MSASCKPPVNPWRGERVVTIGEVNILLCATHDDLARIFAVTDTGSLGQLLDTLATLNPAVLRGVFDILVQADDDAERDRLWEAVPGVTGLVMMHGAMIQAISGKTPEEEKQAEKDALEKAEAAKAERRTEMADLLKEILPTMLAAMVQTDPIPSTPKTMTSAPS